LVSEILTGKKTGMRKVVEFAKRLGVSVEWLTGDQFLIPLVSEVTASSPFQFRENGYLELFAITLPVITKQTVMNFYALRVQGDSMIPSHKDRDILIVERNSRGKIKHGDTVILHKEKEATSGPSTSRTKFQSSGPLISPAIIRKPSR
jgi:SOS-response transcriptional repressor LexA